MHQEHAEQEPAAIPRPKRWRFRRNRSPVVNLLLIALAVLATERSDAAAAEEQYPELKSQSGTVLILLGMAADR